MLLPSPFQTWQLTSPTFPAQNAESFLNPFFSSYLTPNALTSPVVPPLKHNQILSFSTCFGQTHQHCPGCFQQPFSWSRCSLLCPLCSTLNTVPRNALKSEPRPLPLNCSEHSDPFSCLSEEKPKIMSTAYKAQMWSPDTSLTSSFLSCTPLQPPWPPGWSSNMSSLFLPQGLCSCCVHCLECFSFPQFLYDLILSRECTPLRLDKTASISIIHGLRSPVLQDLS